MRVVLDTNCVVSALIFSKGRMAKFRELWISGKITPVVSNETILELIRVLAYPKFSLDRTEIDILLGDYLPFTETCIQEQVMDNTPELEDPDDEIFIRLAKTAKPDFLVSGDKHILHLRELYPRLNIIDPSEFLAKIQL